MESAYRALRAPSKLIDGEMAVCQLACEGLSSAGKPNIAQRKLYVGGLSPNTNSEMLHTFFGRHGEIEEGSVAHDRETKTSRCYGFITYKTAEAAKKAIDDPQKTLGGRNLTVEFADNHWEKVEQPQIAAEDMVEYPQPGTAYHGSHPVGYIYPHTMETYPIVHYPSPPIRATIYPPQPQILFTPITVNTWPTPPPQMGGYPVYHARQ